MKLFDEFVVRQKLGKMFGGIEDKKILLRFPDLYTTVGFYCLEIQQKLFPTLDIDIHIFLMKEFQRYEQNLNHTKVF